MHQTPRDSDQPAEVCIICGTGFDDTKSVCLTRKGATTVLSFTERRGRSDMKNTIEGCLSTDPIGRILVHADCRRDFTDHKRPALATDNDNSSVTAAKQLRSSFNFKDDCFICGHSTSTSSKYKDRSKVCRVMTLPLRDNLLALCANRSDSVAAAVRTRLSGCMDLVAAEAVYHALCLTRFELGREVKLVDSSVHQGRSSDQAMRALFDGVCDWLESEADELCTIQQLHAKMVDLAEGSAVYSMKWLKEKLREHYGEFLFFAEVGGRKDVICFRNMAKFLINEKWYTDRKADVAEESERIITTAAKLIRSEMRGMKCNVETYPDKQDVSSIDRGHAWLPQHLLLFLDKIIPSPLKRNTIGHAMVQSCRPASVITPTLFGVGVEMDHVFGSRWLIDELFRLGFSISYDEVQRYKQSVIQEETIGNAMPGYFHGTFTQWVADNVDHNIHIHPEYCML